MVEEDSIKFAALHLDGIAHDWWHHGMVTLQHDRIITYQEFGDRLVERFDRWDPELYFRDLTQLEQMGSLESYIGEFQKLSVMVTGILERRLVILFIEGLWA